MNKNLLIVGAGCYGLVAKETAESMGCFKEICFLDDTIKEMPDGSKVLGKVDDFEDFVTDYSYIFVAIADPEIKLNLLKEIKETTPYTIATLISPKAYISPTAQVMQGTLIEAMATINTGAVISVGCIIGAGSVVNHCSLCCDGVHLECNAVVSNNTLVPAGTNIGSGVVYKKDTIDIDIKNWKVLNTLIASHL